MLCIRGPRAFSRLCRRKRGNVLGGSKSRRLLIVAILIISVVAVAIPVGLNAACSMSDQAMSSMPASSYLSHALFPVVTALCDMGAVVRTGAESVLPAISSGTASLLVALVALIAVAALLPQQAPRRAVAFFARAMAPPGDLRGVRRSI